LPTTRQVAPTSITAQLGEPSTVAASVSRDIPDQNATPIESIQSFVSDPTQSACFITPDVLPYLGQPVTLRVWVKATGTVEQAWLAEDNVLPNAYTSLAICLLKEWKFHPAITGGEAVESDNLIIPVTINR